MAESTDPYIATVMAIPTPGYDGVAEMARTFVEEFALMGWSRERIARMFRIPRYAGAYAVLQARGPEFVTALIEDVLGPEGESSAGERGADV